MSEKKVVEALVSGGQATAGPPLGPALGPLGVNVLAIVNKINEVTKNYAGMKVPVKITVNAETKEFEVSVGTPTTSALIVSELGISKGSGAPKTEKVGNLSMAQVVHVANIKQRKLARGSMTRYLRRSSDICQIVKNSFLFCVTRGAVFFWCSVCS